MKNPELSRIKSMVQNTFDGAAFHGASIMEIIDKISANQAFHPSEHIHRICELVQHITAWRIFAVKRLEGDVHYEVTQTEDWKTFINPDATTWEEIKSELAKSQNSLVRALDKTSDDRLKDEVEGKAYDYYTLIHGVIQHDLYHLGEIALLARELDQME
jgi:hypothetical protein